MNIGRNFQIIHTHGSGVISVLKKWIVEALNKLKPQQDFSIGLMLCGIILVPPLAYCLVIAVRIIIGWSAIYLSIS